MSRSKATVAVVLALVSFSIVGLLEIRPILMQRGFIHPPPTGLGPPQGFDGNVTLTPISPVCQASAPTVYAPPPWSNISVSLSGAGSKSESSMAWKLYENCRLVGDLGRYFVLPGTYFLDISYCSSEQVRTFGCQNMPAMIIINANQIIHLALKIDTGIR